MQPQQRKNNAPNLPTQITVAGNQGGTIQFYYTATGQKVQKTVQSNAGTTTTLYDHGFIYKGGQLQFFSQPEGYIKANNDGSFTYVFQYKDHTSTPLSAGLGNIRLSYKNTYNGTILNPDVTVVEAHDYYPFGLEHKGYNETPNSDEYPFKYNGKELEKALGLDWYDYGARWYDAAVGRWLGVDPLAGKYPGWSPYGYALDNPVNFIDPTGMVVQDWVMKKDGTIYWDKNANSQATTKKSETYLGKTLAFTFNVSLRPTPSCTTKK